MKDGYDNGSINNGRWATAKAWREEKGMKDPWTFDEYGQKHIRRYGIIRLKGQPCEWDSSYWGQGDLWFGFQMPKGAKVTMDGVTTNVSFEEVFAGFTGKRMTFVFSAYQPKVFRWLNENPIAKRRIQELYVKTLKLAREKARRWNAEQAALRGGKVSHEKETRVGMVR